MTPFRLVVAFVAILLSGCYASNTLLLDGDAATQPLADGVYRRDGDPADAWRVSAAPDGWYAVERFNANGTVGETRRAVFNPLGSIGGHPAYAIAVETDDGFAYAAALVDAGRVFLAAPDCGDPLDRDLAEDHGGAPGDDEASSTCSFHNRGALLAALGAYAGQADFGRPYQRR